MITEPGVFFDMPCEEYFADPCPEPSLSNSGIGILLHQSPMHFAARHPRLNGGVDSCKTNTAMRRGSVVHRLALGAGKDYAVIDFADWRKDAAKAQRVEAEAGGLVPILKHAFVEAQEQAKVVRGHLDELLLGEEFLPEVVIAWQVETKHGPVWCRGMMDAWCPSLNLVVDLKSTTDASMKALTRRIANGGYDTQAAWYPAGLGHILGKPGEIRFATLFVENDAPHASQAIELDEAWRSSAWDLCEEALEIFANCSKAKSWPGYPRNPIRLSPPDWLIRDRMYRGFARDGHAELNDSPLTTTDEEMTHGDSSCALIPGE
jgi:hypothetical protein